MDQALAFKANIYNQLTEDYSGKSAEYTALQRETLEKRATLASATRQDQSRRLLHAGVGFWKESYDLNASYVSHNRSIPAGHPRKDEAARS